MKHCSILQRSGSLFTDTVQAETMKIEGFLLAQPKRLAFLGEQPSSMPELIGSPLVVTRQETFHTLKRQPFGDFMV